jgi:hypothetical protein
LYVEMVQLNLQHQKKWRLGYFTFNNSPVIG